MPTTMVITTVVTADVDVELDVEKVKNYAFEYVRNQEERLVSELTDKGVDAQVTTTMLDVNQLLDYLRLRRQEERVSTATPSPVTAEAAVETEAMSEGEFLTYTLQQLRMGEAEPTLRLSAAEVASFEDEQIGAEFSRYPFLY